VNKEYIHLGIRETGTKSTSNHSTEILTFSWRFCRWLRAVLTRSLRGKDHLPPTYLQKKRSRTHATSAAVKRAKWDSQVRLFLLFKSHGVVGKSFAILYVCDGCGFRVMPNVTLRHVAESAWIISISHPSNYLPSAAAVLYQPDSCELPLLPDTCSILFWIYSQPKEIASSRLTSFPAISRGVSQGWRSRRGRRRRKWTIRSRTEKACGHTTLRTSPRTAVSQA